MKKLDTDYPMRLLADRRPFEEVITAVEELVQHAHATKNYGLIVDAEGTRVTVLSVYKRPAEEQVAALDNYFSMQPDPAARAAKALMACVNYPELAQQYLPALIAELSDIDKYDALVTRMREMCDPTTAS